MEVSLWPSLPPNRATGDGFTTRAGSGASMEPPCSSLHIAPCFSLCNTPQCPVIQDQHRTLYFLILSYHLFVFAHIHIMHIPTTLPPWYVRLSYNWLISSEYRPREPILMFMLKHQSWIQNTAASKPEVILAAYRTTCDVSSTIAKALSAFSDLFGMEQEVFFLNAIYLIVQQLLNSLSQPRQWSHHYHNSI